MSSFFVRTIRANPPIVSIRRYQMWCLACALAASAGVAQADDVGDDGSCAASMECAADDSLDFWWERSAFDDVDMDTGWLPNGASVQVRLGVRILGRSEVALGGSLDGDWSMGPFEAAVSGVQDSGRFSVGYGIETTAKFRFNVSVLGKNFHWEGDIPTPATIPSDLLIEADTTFTPFHLSGSSPGSVVIDDETGRAAAFSVGIGDNFVNIPGVAGKVSLDIRATLRAEYSDRDITIGEDLPVIEQIDDSVEIAAPDDGFGAAYDTTVDVQGNIKYTAGVTLYPNVELRILGFTIIDKDLFSFHQDVPSFNVGVDFDVEEASLGLPDATYEPAELAVVGAGGATLSVENRGDATLRLAALEWPAALAPMAGPLLVAPGERLELVVGLKPEISAPVDETTVVSFRTNDPDQPVIELPITLWSGDEVDEDSIPGPVAPMPSGCACRAAGGSPSGGLGLLLVMVGAVFSRRRRSRRSSPRP